MPDGNFWVEGLADSCLLCLKILDLYMKIVVGALAERPAALVPVFLYVGF